MDYTGRIPPHLRKIGYVGIIPIVMERLKECGSTTMSWTEFASSLHTNRLVEKAPAVIFFAGPPNEELLFRLCTRTWERKISLYTANYPEQTTERILELVNQGVVPELIVLDFSKNESITIIKKMGEDSRLQNASVIILVPSSSDLKKTSSIEKIKNYHMESRPDDYLELKDQIKKYEDFL